MKVEPIANMLRSRTRVNILKILGEKQLRAIDVYYQYSLRFKGEQKHREFIYKQLEKMLESGLLEKNYDSEIKGITYKLKFKKISIDLLNGEITAQ